MEDIQKLHHLIEHWMEHNQGHIETYLKWADIAEGAGRKELAEILRQVADETKKADVLLERTKKLSL